MRLPLTVTDRLEGLASAAGMSVGAVVESLLDGERAPSVTDEGLRRGAAEGRRRPLAAQHSDAAVVEGRRPPASADPLCEACGHAKSRHTKFGCYGGCRCLLEKFR